MLSTNRFLAASCALLLATPLLTLPLCAQEPTLKVKPADKPAEPTTTLKISAKLVNLPVVVYDKKGALLQNLTKADFALSVDGHAQTIQYFDRDQDVPLTLGLLVDVSRSQSGVLGEERTASGTFLDEMITTPPAPAPASTAARKPDQAFIIQFGHSAELLGDLTASKPKLQASIQQIDVDAGSQGQATAPGGDPNDPNNPANSGGNRGGRGGGNGGGAHRGGGTVLYDAVYLSSNELTAKQTGRKALILLTDGVDNGSKKTIGEAIEAAQRADTMIFSIYFKGEEHQDYNQNRGSRGGGFPGGGGGYPGGRGGGGYPGGGGQGGGQGQPNGGNGPEHRPFVDGKKVLERMSEETGGRLFEVSRKQKVADIYKMIGDELRGEYRLGYIPDANTAAEGYHKVELTIPTQKQDYIQTREGYYTGK